MNYSEVKKVAAPLIEGFESRRLKAYRCPAGVLTIGVGSTSNVKDGMIITNDECDARLNKDMDVAIRAIDEAVKVKLNTFQAAALTSFIFNIGVGAFKKSTLLRVLNAGKYDIVPAQLARWNKANGKVLKGLVARRQAEADMFMADWKADTDMPQEITPPDKSLVKSRTMANATLAGGVGTALMVAPAIEPAGQVIELAQNNTQGFLLVVGIAFVVFALVAAYLRWDDKRKA